MADFSCPKYCPKRDPRCHGHCEKYLEEKAIHDEKLAKVRLEQDVKNYVNESIGRGLDYSARRKKDAYSYRIVGPKGRR